MIGPFPVKGFLEFGASAGFEFTATELNGDGGFTIDNEGMTITREMMMNKSTHSHTKKYGCGIPICNHTSAFHTAAGGHNNTIEKGDSITNKEIKEKAAYAKKIDLESIQDEPESDEEFLQVDSRRRKKSKSKDFSSVAKNSQCADSPRVYVGKAMNSKECANLVAADTKIYAKLVTDKKYHHETCFYGSWKTPTLIGTFSSPTECARAYWRAKKKFCPGCKEEDMKQKVFYWYVKNPDHYYNGYYSDHSCYVNNDDTECVKENNGYCDSYGEVEPFKMADYKGVQSVLWHFRGPSCEDMTWGAGTYGSMRVHPFTIGEMKPAELKVSLMYFTYSNSKYSQVCYREMPGVCQKDCNWNGLSPTQIPVLKETGKSITGLKYAQAPYAKVCQLEHTPNKGMDVYKTTISTPTKSATVYRPAPQLCAEPGVGFPFNGGGWALKAGPTFDVFLRAGIGLDLGLLYVGVAVEVSLFNIELMGTADLRIGGNFTQNCISLSITVTTLEGRIYLFLDFKVIDEFEVDLLAWSGFTWSWPSSFLSDPFYAGTCWGLPSAPPPPFPKPIFSDDCVVTLYNKPYFQGEKIGSWNTPNSKTGGTFDLKTKRKVGKTDQHPSDIVQSIKLAGSCASVELEDDDDAEYKNSLVMEPGRIYHDPVWYTDKNGKELHSDMYPSVWPSLPYLPYDYFKDISALKVKSKGPVDKKWTAACKNEKKDKVNFADQKTQIIPSKAQGYFQWFSVAVGANSGGKNKQSKTVKINRFDIYNADWKSNKLTEDGDTCDVFEKDKKGTVYKFDQSYANKFNQTECEQAVIRILSVEAKKMEDDAQCNTHEYSVNLGYTDTADMCAKKASIRGLNFFSWHYEKSHYYAGYCKGEYTQHKDCSDYYGIHAKPGRNLYQVVRKSGADIQKIAKLKPVYSFAISDNGWKYCKVAWYGGEGKPYPESKCTKIKSAFTKQDGDDIENSYSLSSPLSEKAWKPENGKEVLAFCNAVQKVNTFGKKKKKKKAAAADYKVVGIRLGEMRDWQTKIKTNAGRRRSNVFHIEGKKSVKDCAAAAVKWRKKKFVDPRKYKVTLVKKKTSCATSKYYMQLKSTLTPEECAQQVMERFVAGYDYTTVAKGVSLWGTSDEKYVGKADTAYACAQYVGGKFGEVKLFAWDAKTWYCYMTPDPLQTNFKRSYNDAKYEDDKAALLAGDRTNTYNQYKMFKRDEEDRYNAIKGNPIWFAWKDGGKYAYNGEQKTGYCYHYFTVDGCGMPCSVAEAKENKKGCTIPDEYKYKYQWTSGITKQLYKNKAHASTWASTYDWYRVSGENDFNEMREQEWDYAYFSYNFQKEYCYVETSDPHSRNDVESEKHRIIHNTTNINEYGILENDKKGMIVPYYATTSIVSEIDQFKLQYKRKHRRRNSNPHAYLPNFPMIPGTADKDYGTTWTFMTVDATRWDLLSNASGKISGAMKTQFGYRYGDLNTIKKSVTAIKVGKKEVIDAAKFHDKISGYSTMSQYNQRYKAKQAVNAAIEKELNKGHPYNRKFYDLGILSTVEECAARVVQVDKMWNPGADNWKTVGPIIAAAKEANKALDKPVAAKALTALVAGMPVRPYFIWGTSRWYTAKKGRCWWKIDQLASEKLVTMKDNNALAGTHKGVFDNGKDNGEATALPSSRRLLNKNKVDAMPFVDDTENIAALAKLIHDISHGMKKGCDSAKDMMREIGIRSFRKLTGVSNMKCNEKDAKAAGFSVAEPMPDGTHFFSISRAAMREMRKRLAKLKANHVATRKVAPDTDLWVHQLSPKQEQTFKDLDDTANKAADDHYKPTDKADDDIERVPDEPQTKAVNPPEKATAVQTSEVKTVVHETGNTMDSESEDPFQDYHSSYSFHFTYFMAAPKTVAAKVCPSVKCIKAYIGKPKTKLDTVITIAPSKKCETHPYQYCLVNDDASGALKKAFKLMKGYTPAISDDKYGVSKTEYCIKRVDNSVCGLSATVQAKELKKHARYGWDVSFENLGVMKDAKTCAKTAYAFGGFRSTPFAYNKVDKQCYSFPCYHSAYGCYSKISDAKYDLYMATKETYTNSVAYKGDFTIKSNAVNKQKKKENRLVFKPGEFDSELTITSKKKKGWDYADLAVDCFKCGMEPFPWG
jgi:hypothetical protein